MDQRACTLEAVAAANGRRVAAWPTAVRSEAGWRRGDPAAANANRQVTEDDKLDRPGADRVVHLRAAVPDASVVDAAVALTAERVAGAHQVVEVLTSDVRDLRALAGHLRARIDVCL